MIIGLPDLPGRVCALSGPFETVLIFIKHPLYIGWVSKRSCTEKGSFPTRIQQIFKKGVSLNLQKFALPKKLC